MYCKIRNRNYDNTGTGGRVSVKVTDLHEKINSRCQRLGLKKPSNDAFCSRLNNLCKRDVLHKDKDKVWRYLLFIEK